MSSLFSWSEESRPFPGISPVCFWHEKALIVRTSITSGDPVVLQKCQSLMQINGQAGCYQTQSGNEDRTYSSRSQDSVSPFCPLPGEFIEWCRAGDLALRVYRMKIHYMIWSCATAHAGACMKRRKITRENKCAVLDGHLSLQHDEIKQSDRGRVKQSLPYRV